MTTHKNNGWQNQNTADEMNQETMENTNMQNMHTDTNEDTMNTEKKDHCSSGQCSNKR